VSLLQVIEQEPVLSDEAERVLGRRRPAGTTAIVVAEGLVIHPELAEEVCVNTELTVIQPLVTSGQRRVYRITVRGYGLDQFLAVVTAFHEERFGDAKVLIRAIYRSLS
jgi:hypothetical protein